MDFSLLINILQFRIITHPTFSLHPFTAWTGKTVPALLEDRKIYRGVISPLFESVAGPDGATGTSFLIAYLCRPRCLLARIHSRTPFHPFPLAFHFRCLNDQ